MFDVVYNGKDLRVNFSYPNEGQTYCKILDRNVVALSEDKNATIAFGFAERHPNDQFVKNKGRKIALRNALFSTPREDRDVFWQAYFEARNGKF